MKLSHVLVALGLLLGFAVACGGGEEGQDCEVNDDCDDGLVCARLAECPDGDCIGVCLARCDSDEDCPGDRFCGSQIGAPEQVCHVTPSRE
jgi:hypothetical protein